MSQNGKPYFYHMKINLSEINPKEMIPGFSGTFVHTDLFTIANWDVKAGSELPEHSHVNIQTSQVLEGKFELTIDGVTEVYEHGSVAVVPSNAVHSGRAITDCKILDIFAPQRPEYNND